jgi:bacterioferritin
MKSDPVVIAQLNAVMKNHLTAMNQYFLHYRMLKNWDISEMAEASYKMSILEMKRADKLMERIFFLEGLPNLQNLGKLAVGDSVPNILKGDTKTNNQAIDTTREAIAVMEEKQDYVSRELLEETLDSQEEFQDYLDTQMWQIENIGLENYIQSQAGNGDD